MPPQRQRSDPLAAGPRRGSHFDLQTDRRVVVVPSYPFHGFVGRDACATLRAWVGIGQFRGGAVLVTGCRGSGKSSAVNKAIYDASVLSRAVPPKFFDLRTRRRPLEAYAEFDRLVAAQSDLRLEVPKAGARADGWQPTLLVEVPINLARPIPGEALIRRIVRSMYEALVRHGVAGLAPGLVASAREAYIRTVTAVQEMDNRTVKESFSNEYRVKLDSSEGAAIEAGVAASHELELARTITLEFPRSDTHEMDEQLLRLLEEFDGTLFGGVDGLSGQLGRVMDWWRAVGAAAANAPRGAWWGDRGVAVHTVFVMDELDKLEHEYRPGTGFVPPPPSQAHGDEMVHDVSSLARWIKPILASGKASFVVVAGPNAARAWMQEAGDPNGLLNSVFSAHAHFGVACLREVTELADVAFPALGAASGVRPPLHRAFAAWLLVACRGSFTRLVSMLRELHARFGGDVDALLRWVGANAGVVYGIPFKRSLIAIAIDRLFYNDERVVPLAGPGSGAYMSSVDHDEMFQCLLHFAADHPSYTWREDDAPHGPFALIERLAPEDVSVAPLRAVFARLAEGIDGGAVARAYVLEGRLGHNELSLMMERVRDTAPAVGVAYTP